MPPNYSANQTHVDKFVSILLPSAVHYVKQLLHKDLRIIDEIYRHKISISWLNFFLSDTTCSLSFFFIKFILSCFSLPIDSFLCLDLRRINSFIITIRQLLQRHRGFHQEMASHKSQLTCWSKTWLSNDVHSTIISPYIFLIEFNHHLQWFLCSFVCVLRNVVRNKCSDLLIDFVILMMAVHSADVVEHILVNHRTQLLILKPHLTQHKLSCTYWQQDALCSQNHDTSYAFLADVGV